MGDRKGSGYRVRTGDAGEKRATIGNRGGTGVTEDEQVIQATNETHLWVGVTSDKEGTSEKKE